MTRIVAGTYGGRRLNVPARGTRPTTDRVREAIFSRLDHAGVLAGASVVDLYAGSGALGLEAISRGAATAVLVDISHSARQAMAANVRALDVAAQVTLVKDKAVNYLLRAEDRSSLAFLDPPYDIGQREITAVLEALAPRLTPHATVLLEASSRAPQPHWPDGITPGQSRDYGETRLYWAHRDSV